ncbi:hypothetical protein NWO25_08345 [Enterococcus lactis]|nr:hypothetical protein [Enterococcus lactis]
MKVTLNRASFMQELQTVQRAISSKTTIPILTGVKITLTQEGLTLTGSNADISIETFCLLKTKKQICKSNLPDQLFYKLVSLAKSFEDFLKKHLL